MMIWLTSWTDHNKFSAHPSSKYKVKEIENIYIFSLWWEFLRCTLLTFIYCIRQYCKIHRVVHYISRTYLSYNWKFVPLLLHPIPPPPSQLFSPCSTSLGSVYIMYHCAERCFWTWVSPLPQSLLPGPGPHEIRSSWAEIQRPKQTNN